LTVAILEMSQPDPPYVVLLGSVGSGKSTIVEKVTGKTSLAADAGLSATKRSYPLWARDGQLIICDTPGSNSIGDKFGHNIWIATAFNYRPVSKIFIVVRAESGRLDTIISSIRDFSDRFVDLPDVPLGVIVTHMDEIKWSASAAGHESDCRAAIKDEADIDDVIFSQLPTQHQALITNILRACSQPFPLTVDHDNFLRLFTKLHKSRPTEVLRSCQKETAEFKKKRQEFYNHRKNFDKPKQVDLVFEFQAYMTQDITRAQIRVAEQFSFTFDGTDGDSQAAHLSNMSNNMIIELRAIRTETLAYQNNHGVSCLRRCPHAQCGQVWTKVEGCEGATICGAIPSRANDQNFSEMATFTFSWNELDKKLTITQSGTKSAKTSGRSAKGTGCGQSINWSSMAPVQLPAEFNQTAAAVATTDVPTLPPSAEDYNDRMDGRLSASFAQMKLGARPSH